MGGLREALALLLREKHREEVPLSADAATAIRRRVAMRRAGGIGVAVAVCALGVATIADAYGGRGGGSASPSAIPTPTIGVGVATFPVAGGPEFVSPVAALKCGDPMPTPHPTEHDVTLGVTATNALTLGDTIQSADDLPSVIAHLSQAAGTKLGVVADSGIWLVVARDGVVVGVLQYGPPEPGWNKVGATSAQNPHGTQLVAPWIQCPGDNPSAESSLKPGTYDIVAVTRVFSTPESVALYQALRNYHGDWNLDPAGLDPNGVYLPGSYDCQQSIQWDAPARACLPDFTPNAKLDASASTVTMLYDKKDLVQEFGAVLVSEPVTVTIPGVDSIPGMPSLDGGPLGTFTSIGDFTCGARAGAIHLTNGSRDSVDLELRVASTSELKAGGAVKSTAWALGVPDGSRVELLPGARIVYLQDSTMTVPDSGVVTGVSTVVASADVTDSQPITTDRFAGPQPLTVTTKPWSMCPGVGDGDITWSNAVLLVGQWRITTPDGTETTVDTAQYLNVY